ncbi:MAG: tail fiber domain-containing protein [Bacteroidales bacterium]|nr:tail fiber domain-containing protein [Bacteroidales bacterium]
MKKTAFILAITILAAYTVNAQVAINTDGSLANSSAILDIKSDQRGLLMPRMSTSQKTTFQSTLSAAENGMIIFDTDEKRFYLWDGSSFEKIRAGVIKCLEDTDIDTKIHVEKNEDEDIIRFETEGKEYFNMNHGRLQVLNTGYSVFIGEGAGISDDLFYHRNVFIGYKAGNSNTAGHFNTAIGFQAFCLNTTGYYNTAIGSEALYHNITGIKNTANGYHALYSNTTGESNTANGFHALYFNTIGHHNTANGRHSLCANDTGSYNTASGYYSLRRTLGDDNTGYGYQSLEFNETGNYNTAVGSNAGPLSGCANLSNTGAFGYQAAPTASNTIHIGNTSINWIGGQVNWSTYSDERFKKNIEENVAGLDFIMKLRPVTYKWDIKKLDNYIGTPEEIYESDEMKSARAAQESEIYTGFLAQEVEQAALETGYDFSGVQSPANEQTPYSIRYAEFVVPLVKAIQEQQAMIDELKVMNESLQKQIDEFKNNR